MFILSVWGFAKPAGINHAFASSTTFSMSYACQVVRIPVIGVALTNDWVSWLLRESWTFRCFQNPNYKHQLTMTEREMNSITNIFLSKAKRAGSGFWQMPSIFYEILTFHTRSCSLGSFIRPLHFMPDQVKDFSKGDRVCNEGWTERRR